MKKPIFARWIGVLAGVLVTVAAHGQATLTFVNSGTGWAAPWYGLAAADASSNCVVYGANSGTFVTADNTTLSGAGWTAQLWAGVEGGWMWEIAPVGQTTFRTGSDSGLLAAMTPLPATFALPGQRIVYQLRVWENKGGTIHNWDEVINNPSARRGSTPIYTSPPLTSGNTALEFTESFVLLPEFAAPVPVLSLSRDGCVQHTGFFPDMPTPEVHEGEDVSLSVVCPSPATTVQWSLNGINLPGATGLTLSLSRIQISQSGVYAAAVTAPIGARTARMTNSLQVTVLPAPRLVQPRLHPTLGFSAAVEGVTNRMVQIEFSDDLRSWTPGPMQEIFYAWACGCLQNTVTIPPPLPANARFYRARLLP